MGKIRDAEGKGEKGSAGNQYILALERLIYFSVCFCGSNLLLFFDVRFFLLLISDIQKTIEH